MPDLAEQIRGVVDRGAPAIPLDEIVTRTAVTATPPERFWPVRRRAVVAAFGLVAVVVVIVSSTVLRTSRGGDVPGAQVSAPASSRDCVVKRADDHGCEASPRDAEQRLGIPIQVPGALPRNWRAVRREIRRYPQGGAINKSDTEVVEYRQIWAPNGVLGSPGSGPRAVISLTARAAAGPEDGAVAPVVHVLPNGVAVAGSIRIQRIGNGAERVVNLANLLWIHEGVTYGFYSAGLDTDEVFEFLDSLRGVSDGMPEPTGAVVTVVQGSDAAGSWSMSAYRAATGLCLRFQPDERIRSGSCIVESATLSGAVSGGSGGSWVYGIAPKQATQVQIEYTDGRTIDIATTVSAAFDVSFFAARGLDGGVIRIVASDERGTALAEQSIPPIPTTPTLTAPEAAVTPRSSPR